MSLSNIGITGSVRVAEMIRDAVDGSDSVDILVVGDSNTLFASESGIASAGWTDGLQHALFSAGAPIYATPIFPAALDSNSQSQGWRSSFANFDSGLGYGGIGSNGMTLDGTTTAFLLSGNSSGPSAITNQFLISGSFGPASSAGGVSRMDYGYYAASSPRYWDYFASVLVDATNPMPIGGAFKYRVVHGVFATGGGSFHLEQTDNGGATTNSLAVSCNGTADGIATAVLDIPANVARTQTMRCAWGGVAAANRNSGKGVVGKAAFLLQSVTKATGKGASVSAMCWAGGNTATQIGNGARGILTTTWQTWLREARARQVACGGSGRVIVLFHAGANTDTNLPGSWVTAHDSVVSMAKGAWAALNYPAHDLGFIAMPSHVIDSTDTLSTIRSHVNTTYADDTDTLVVDLGVIAPYAQMSAMQWYDNTAGSGGSSTAGVHLWGGGYEAVSALIVGRMLGYVDGGAVDLETVKTALKIDYDDDDDELERLIHSAESFLEKKTGVDFTTKSRTLYLRSFRRTVFTHQPLIEALQVSYRNTSGVLTVLPTTSWWIDLSNDLAAIEFLDPPEIKEGTLITVQYSSGYTDTPQEIVQAVISLVGHWYNNPEAAQAVGLQEVPLGFKYLVDQISNRAPFS